MKFSGKTKKDPKKGFALPGKKGDKKPPPNFGKKSAVSPY